MTTEICLTLSPADSHALGRVVAGLHSAGIPIRQLSYADCQLVVTVDSQLASRVRRRVGRMVCVIDLGSPDWPGGGPS